MQAAARLIQALTLQGIRVPEEIGVVGYYDLPTATASRTLRMPSRNQGRIAVKRLVEILDGTLTDFYGEVVGDEPECVLKQFCRAVLMAETRVSECVFRANRSFFR